MSKTLSIFLTGGQTVTATMPDDVAQAFVAKWHELADDPTSLITFGESALRPTAIDGVVVNE